MANSPKVSVLIPTYNHGHLIEDAIQSVLAQTFTDYELIVVDNASTDNTREIVAKYLSDPRVKYYRNPTNLGLAGNWNKCLDYAEGEYFKLLCSDDKMHPRMLERYVPIMDEHPSVAFLGAQNQWFGENIEPKIVKAPAEGHISGRAAIGMMIKSDNDFIAEPSVPMLRRSNLAGERFGQLEYVTDWEMWVRQLHKGDCYIIPEVLCYNRRHPGQQQKRVKKAGTHHLEMYHIYADLRNNKYPYAFPELKAELDQITKIKATKCAFAFYRLLPFAYQKSTRATLKRLWKVAVNERVLFGPGVIGILLGKIKERLSKRFRSEPATVR